MKLVGDIRIKETSSTEVDALTYQEGHAQLEGMVPEGYQILSICTEK